MLCIANCILVCIRLKRASDGDSGKTTECAKAGTSWRMNTSPSMVPFASSIPKCFNIPDSVLYSLEHKHRNWRWCREFWGESRGFVVLTIYRRDINIYIYIYIFTWYMSPHNRHQWPVSFYNYCKLPPTLFLHPFVFISVLNPNKASQRTLQMRQVKWTIDLHRKRIFERNSL